MHYYCDYSASCKSSNKWSEKILPLTYTCFSGSHCRRRLTGWVLMLWPLCLLPVSCGVLTPLTLSRVYRTLARPQRKTSTVFAYLLCMIRILRLTLWICASAAWRWSSVNRWINTEPDWRTSALWSSLRAKPRSVSHTSGGQWYELLMMINLRLIRNQFCKSSFILYWYFNSWPV